MILHINNTQKRVSRVLVTWFVLLPLALSMGQGFQRYAGEFLNLETSARAQAVGGAALTFQNDISALLYNPAGLSTLTDTQVALMHAWQFVNFINFDFVTLGYRLDERRVIGISFSRLGIDNIPDTRNAQVFYGSEWRLDWSRVTRFSTADYVLNVSVAQTTRRWGAVGFSTRLVYRDFGDVQAWGVGIDIGWQKEIKEHLIVGAVIRNITTTMINWSNGTREWIAPQFRLGVAYPLQFPSIHSQFTPMGEVVVNTVGNTSNTAQGGLRTTYGEILGGAEWTYRQAVSFRMGVDPLGRFTAGAGIQIPHIRFDYAFLSFSDELGNAHRVGIVIRF